MRVSSQNLGRRCHYGRQPSARSGWRFVLRGSVTPCLLPSTFLTALSSGAGAGWSPTKNSQPCASKVCRESSELDARYLLLAVPVWTADKSSLRLWPWFVPRRPYATAQRHDPLRRAPSVAVSHANPGAIAATAEQTSALSSGKLRHAARQLNWQLARGRDLLGGAQ